MPIPACVICDNLLVQKYLERLIAADQELRLVQMEQVACDRIHRVAFVIDRRCLAVSLRECLSHVKLLCDDGKAIVVDEHFSADADHRLLWLGVHGILRYAEVDASLGEAIRRIHSGGAWIPSDMLSAISKSLDSKQHNTPAGDCLTGREAEILERIEQHESNRQIADTLDISVNTVKFHVANILAKEQAANRAELLRVRSSPPVARFGSRLLKALTAAQAPSHSPAR